jgi:hypothetical protein
MKHISLPLLITLVLSPKTLACGFHEGVGMLNIPNYPGIMFTLTRVNAALEVGMIKKMEKPAAMLNWQLAQKLNSTIPVDNITFYQVSEGHYSTIGNDDYRWLGDYQSETKPALGELMILSELIVMNALLDGTITIDKALNEMWIKVNGPKVEREAVTQWLKEAFS